MKREAPMTKRVASAKAEGGYRDVLTGVVDLVESARHAVARSVNAVMTATYWEIGRRIVEFEQRGSKRAGYGEELMERLAGDLTRRFGRGFSFPNLHRFRQFYLAYPAEQILSTVSRELGGEICSTVSSQSGAAICRTPSGKSQTGPRRLPHSIRVGPHITTTCNGFGHRSGCEPFAARASYDSYCSVVLTRERGDGRKSEQEHGDPRSSPARLRVKPREENPK